MFRIVKGMRNGLFGLAVAILLLNGEVYCAEKIRTVIVGDLISMDPAKFTFAQDRLIAQQILQGLVTFDVNTEPPHPVTPVLAKKYEISDDGKVITFALHEGIQFHHNYGELTSEDVVFSLLRHLDPKVASVAKADLSDVDRIEAPSKYTVKIYLKSPSALTVIQNLAWQNAGFILSKNAVQKLGSMVERMAVGTGPFYFDRWEAGEKVVLKKFEKYWRARPRIDEIELWIVPEEIVALGALAKGDLEIVPVSQLGSYERAKTIKGVSLMKAKGNIWQYPFFINFKMKPMDDIRVRRALAHALDVKGICERIGPLVVPFPSPLAPAVFAATDEFWNYEYNLDKAKQLLSEAGYPNGFELRLIYNKSVLYEPIALEVKNCWSKIVDVKLELVERAVFVKTMGEYKHHVAEWGLARTAPYLYAQYYETGSPRNYCQYSNPKVDELILKAKTAKNEREAKRYWRDFQKAVTDDMVIYIPAVGGNSQAISNKVKGVKLYPYTGLIDLEGAYISK